MKMKMKKILQSTLLLSAVFIGSAQASVTMGFNPDEDFSVTLGEVVTLGISFDFGDTVITGGKLRMSYDEEILSNPVFNFQSSTYLAQFGIQSEFTQFKRGFDSPSNTRDINFGALTFVPQVKGAGLLGYLTFDTLAEGITEISLKDKGNGFAVAVDYQNASVNVSNVPVPAAVWLFASACGLLVGSRKRLNNKLSQV